MDDHLLVVTETEDSLLELCAEEGWVPDSVMNVRTEMEMLFVYENSDGRGFNIRFSKDTFQTELVKNFGLIGVQERWGRAS